MKLKDKELLLDIIGGKRLDFYLEDDMFEIEGRAKKENGEIIVEVLDAVRHVLEMTGKHLKIYFKYKKLFAERTDNGKTFEMEINRVYDLLTDPTAEDFTNMENSGVEQFFKKQTDTLVWNENDKWTIELNKVNMYFSGDRYYYDSLKELFDANAKQMIGNWQAVYYSSEPELD